MPVLVAGGLYALSVDHSRLRAPPARPSAELCQPDLHRWPNPHWPPHSLPTGRSESRADELQPRPWAATIASIALARRRRPALLQVGSGASQIDLMEARDRRASVTSNLRSPEPATATVSEATFCKTSVEHAPVLLPSKLELPIRSPAAGACSAPSASRTLAAAKIHVVASPGC